MGNAIKNYERKKRKEQKEAQRESYRLIHDVIVERMGIPYQLKDKEKEIFDLMN